MPERPDIALGGLSRSKAQDLLERIARDERPVTHDVLDELPPGKVLAHLRSVLVATGALPPRDERLIALEKWITTAVQAAHTPPNAGSCTALEARELVAVMAGGRVTNLDLPEHEQLTMC